MAIRVLAAYRARLAKGALATDAAQLRAVGELDRLERQLRRYVFDGRLGLLGIVFGKSSIPPRGIYLHGGVGRGKTMLMDLFFDVVRFPAKRRVHFHAFMQDVHKRIAVARHGDAGDPIAIVARDLAEAAKLLCLDEFHITDIADAMILGRLFTALFQHGVVVVATSNAAPDDLYKDGLNRALFLPFVAQLKQAVNVRELMAAKDYRQEKLIGQSLYVTPLGDTASRKLAAVFRDLTGIERGAAPAAKLEVSGRTITLPAAAKGVACTDFASLCGQPLGSADYLAIARAYHTLILDGVPRLGPDNRNEARRFINLIDVLYDQRRRLVIAADAEPDELYVAGDGAELFLRTASRLTEMRSADYLTMAPPPPA